MNETTIYTWWRSKTNFLNIIHAQWHGEATIVNGSFQAPGLNSPQGDPLGLSSKPCLKAETYNKNRVDQLLHQPELRNEPRSKPQFVKFSTGFRTVDAIDLGSVPLCPLT